MADSYTVVKGDTLSGIAARKYGDGTKYKIIIDANPDITNPDLIFPGTVLTIPDLVPSRPSEPEEVEVTPETIVDGLSEEVSIAINDKVFKLWSTGTITRSFDSMADSFSLSVPWFPDNEEDRARFKPFKYDKIALYVGGKKILTGTLLTLTTNTTANSRGLTLGGYSKPGIMADVSVSSSSWPFSMDGLDLQQIAEKLAKPFSIPVVFEDDPGPKFKKSEKQRVKIDDKIGTFLIKLAKQRGFVIGSSVDGEMVFRKTTTEPATVTIREGELPYLSSNASFNGQNRYSDITAVGTEMGKGSGQKATDSDPELKANGINRPLTFKATDTNSGNLKAAATAEIGRRLANSVPINVSVLGLHRPDNELWADNQKVVYQSPGDMIYKETEFLIRNAVYNITPKAATASLSLVFPEAYSGEIREEFPWA